MNIILLLFFLIVILILINIKTETFQIPLRDSSGWDWNMGPGYGAGYGTGYSMWGIWPGMIPTEPWKNWMWRRRPLIFKDAYIPVPQIDYNNTPKSNYTFTLAPNGGIAVDGKYTTSLQFDRNRNYYLHIYIPTDKMVITDSVGTILAGPISNGTLTLQFTDPNVDKLYYKLVGDSSKIGTIYLNSTRWI